MVGMPEDLKYANKAGDPGRGIVFQHHTGWIVFCVVPESGAYELLGPSGSSWEAARLANAWMAKLEYEPV